MSIGRQREADVAPRRSDVNEERVSRGASFALLAQLIGAALTATLTIFLGRALSAPQYGAFTFALNVVVIGALVADLGITASSDRFIAERRDRSGEAAAVLRTAWRLKVVIGMPVAVATFVLASPICSAFGIPDAVWPLRICAVVLVAQSMFLLFLGAFTALGKLRYNVVLAAIESVAEVVTSVLLVLLGAQATGAVAGRAIGYVIGTVAAIVVARRAIGRLRGDREDRSVLAPRRILRYAGPLLIVEAAFRVFASIDVLLIAAIVGGGSSVAAFALPIRLVAFLEYPAAALTSAVAPRLAARAGRPGRDAQRLLTISMRYLTLLQMLLVAPLVIWPEAIMHLLFGDKYSGAPAVLRLLAPFVLLSGLAQLATLSVNYLGEARRRVPIALAMVSVNVVLDVILLPRIGIVGAAIATSAAYAVWVPAHLWLLRRHAGLTLRPLLITMLRACVAAGAVAGVLALLGTGVVAVPLMLAGALAGLGAYVGILILLRELTSADAAIVREVLRRRAPA